MPVLSARQRQLGFALREWVQALAGGIGPRALTRLVKSDDAYVMQRDPSRLHLAQHWLEDELTRMGCTFERQEYRVDRTTCTNLITERPGFGSGDEIIVVGAHYDTVAWSPGANDNASGVAALLALADAFKKKQPMRTLRFVFFVNEEMPYGGTPSMGSHVYARACRERGDHIVAMISLDEIGYFTDQPKTQLYPFPLNLLYPSTGDFIGFATNLSNKSLLDSIVTTFRRHAKLPSEGLALNIDDVGRSDHWSFWEHDYPALIVTDTADFRYAHYHGRNDTPDKLDYDRFALLVSALEYTVSDLAGGLDHLAEGRMKGQSLRDSSSRTTNVQTMTQSSGSPECVAAHP